MSHSSPHQQQQQQQQQASATPTTLMDAHVQRQEEVAMAPSSSSKMPPLSSSVSQTPTTIMMEQPEQQHQFHSALPIYHASVNTENLMGVKPLMTTTHHHSLPHPFDPRLAMTTEASAVLHQMNTAATASAGLRLTGGSSVSTNSGQQSHSLPTGSHQGSPYSSGLTSTSNPPLSDPSSQSILLNSTLMEGGEKIVELSPNGRYAKVRWHHLNWYLFTWISIGYS